MLPTLRRELLRATLSRSVQRDAFRRGALAPTGRPAWSNDVQGYAAVIAEALLRARGAPVSRGDAVRSLLPPFEANLRKLKEHYAHGYFSLRQALEIDSLRFALFPVSEIRPNEENPRLHFQPSAHPVGTDLSEEHAGAGGRPGLQQSGDEDGQPKPAM